MRDRVKFFLIFGISLLLIGSIGMSFALFTTGTERKGSLNIIAANTSCPLESDELDENNQIILNGGESKEITVKLTNNSVMPVHSIITYTSDIEDIKIYYVGSNVDELENDNLKISENKTYRLVVENNSNSTQIITLNARCGLANKDLALNENDKTINEVYNPPVDLSKVPLMKTWTYSKSYEIPPGGETPQLVVIPPSEDFHEYHEQITNIIFSNKLEEPAGTIERWDVSEAGDGRVMAYMLDDEENPGNYKVIIAGDGGVYANPKHDMTNDGEEYPGLLNDFSNLKKMDVTYLNVSQLTDMSYMFGHLSLTSGSDVFAGVEIIGLNNWSVSKVTNMYSMFEGCSQLTDLDLSGWDMSSVTNMSRMFYACCQLSSVSGLNGWVTSSVTDMSDMFAECDHLITLDLSGWDTSNATDMSGLFANSSQITAIRGIEKMDTSRVTDMSNMFLNCHQLTSLDLSKWDTSRVTNMSQMFYDCSQLSTLDISGWDTSSVTNMSSMFYVCSQLSTTIAIRGNVTSYNRIFANAATEDGASITVNYIDDTTKAVAEAMVATKYPSTAHVSLGTQVE